MEDFYFIISPEKTIKAICLECNKSKEGFFWNSENGINQEIICSICDKIIYKELNDSEDDIQN